MIELRRDDVEAAKVALKMAMRYNISVPDVVSQAVLYSLEWNELTENNKSLQSALALIQGYLEMGYRYDLCEKIFNEVLAKMGTSYDRQFLGMRFSAAEIRLTKAQLRVILGRWNRAKQGEMKIDEVVEDIMAKIRSQINGRFIYKNGDLEKGGKVFELLIDGENYCLYDKLRDKYYSLIPQEEK